MSFLLFSFSLNAKVNVIWQIDSKGFYETDWIKELLENVDYREINDGDYEIVQNHSIIIISLHGNQRYKDYFAKFDQNKYKYAIIHVGDELYSHPVDCYKMPSLCRAIIGIKSSYIKKIYFPSHWAIK